MDTQRNSDKNDPRDSQTSTPPAEGRETASVAMTPEKPSQAEGERETTDESTRPDGESGEVF